MSSGKAGLAERAMTNSRAGGAGADAPSPMLWGFAFLTLIIALPALIVGAMALVHLNKNSNGNCPLPATDTLLGEAGGEGGSHWTYSGETGPEMWGNLSTDFKACATGQRQSPINIKTAVSTVDSSLSLSKSMFSDMGQLLVNDFQNLVTATHNGHAVGVSGIQGFLTYQNNDYKLLQFHFHTPSEHRIDDTLYKAEVHFVHQSAAGKYLVVGVLIDEAVTSPAYWGTDLLDKFPKSKDESPVPALELSYANLIQGLLGDAAVNYWTYSGSFTTPPCTEEVTWVVVKQVAAMSGDHINALQKATGVNNRPVLPLNDRTITRPS